MSEYMFRRAVDDFTTSQESRTTNVAAAQRALAERVRLARDYLDEGGEEMEVYHAYARQYSKTASFAFAEAMLFILYSAGL